MRNEFNSFIFFVKFGFKKKINIFALLKNLNNDEL